MSDPFALMREYVAQTAAKRELDRQLRELRDELSAMEEQLAEHFASEGIQNIKVAGATLYVATDSYPRLVDDPARPKEELQAALVAALERNHMEWLVTHSPQRLRGWVNEHGFAALPDDVRACLDPNQQKRVRVKSA